MQADALLDLAGRLEAGETSVDDIDVNALLVAFALRNIAAGREFAGQVGEHSNAKAAGLLPPVDKLNALQRDKIINGIAAYLRQRPDAIPAVETLLAELPDLPETEADTNGN